MVSIILPCYNCDKWIEETVKSILHQTFTNWKLICIDDCSTDNTRSILRNFEIIDKRISTVYLNKNQGVSNARNVGLNMADAQYIAFIDSDDLWEKEKLQRQVSFLSNSSYSIVCSDYIMFWPNGKEKIRAGYGVITYQKMLYSNYIPMSSAIIESKAIGGIRFRNISHEDYDFWLQIMQNGHNCFRLNSLDMRYRSGIKSLSSNLFKSFFWHIKILRIHRVKSRIIVLGLFKKLIDKIFKEA